MNELSRRRRALMAAAKKGKSDMNGWTDGVAYTDLTIVENSYVAPDGAISSYNGWSRTGFVPCGGAVSITFPPLGQNYAGDPRFNYFYNSANASSASRVQQITLSKTQSKTIAVPSTAKYFVISSTTSGLINCVNAGIIPNA